MEIKIDGSLSIKFEMRGEKTVLIADTKSQIGRLTAEDDPPKAGLDLECVTPSEAESKNKAGNIEQASRKRPVPTDHLTEAQATKRSGRDKGDGLNTDL